MAAASMPQIIIWFVEMSLLLQNMSIIIATKLIGVPGRPGRTAPIKPMMANRSARITSRMSMYVYYCGYFNVYVYKVNSNDYLRKENDMYYD